MCVCVCVCVFLRLMFCSCFLFVLLLMKLCQTSEFISLRLVYHYHCKNSLVVLTGEWLPWLHSLLGTIGQLYKTTSFLVVSASFHSEMRKSVGNNEETTSLFFHYYYQTKTCNQGNHSVVETTNLFQFTVYTS